MDWLRLTKAIGIVVGLLGIIAGVAWIINTNLYVALTVVLMMTFAVFVFAIYIIIGD